MQLPWNPFLNSSSHRRRAQKTERRSCAGPEPRTKRHIRTIRKPRMPFDCSAPSLLPSPNRKVLDKHGTLRISNIENRNVQGLPDATGERGHEALLVIVCRPHIHLERQPLSFPLRVSFRLLQTGSGNISERRAPRCACFEQERGRAARAVAGNLRSLPSELNKRMDACASSSPG